LWSWFGTEGEALIREHGHLCQRVDAQEVNPDSELVRTAAELGLAPVAPRSQPNRVTANCPSGQHFIMIPPGSEQFGCRYCKRRGGPAGLRAVFRERREKKPRKTGG